MFVPGAGGGTNHLMMGLCCRMVVVVAGIHKVVVVAGIRMGLDLDMTEPELARAMDTGYECLHSSCSLTGSRPMEEVAEAVVAETMVGSNSVVHMVAAGSRAVAGIAADWKSFRQSLM